jgi:predicted metal-binding protein
VSEFTCPECRGSGGETRTELIERINESERVLYFATCYYCAGTGFQTDDEPEEKIVKWEK